MVRLIFCCFSKLEFSFIQGDASGSDVYYSLKHGKRLEKPSRCPVFIYQIMLKCWEWDEKKRPTFYQLVQFLKNDPDYYQSNKNLRISNLIDEIHTNNEQYKKHGNDHEF